MSDVAHVSIEPFYRPRRLGVRAVVRRFQRGQAGDCFAYAVREILAWSDAGEPAPPMRVAHGTARIGRALVAHAWIERGGFAYDWQRLALTDLGALPLSVFYVLRAAVAVATYDAAGVAAHVLRAKHHGPWEGPVRDGA